MQSLERDRIGCVLLDDVDGVDAGDSVRGTGDVVRAPVGPELLGRVVDPLGRPLDGKGPISTKTSMPIERPAPAIIDRDLVVQPVQTGLVVIDALFALGRGQRELIIGDRAIGKTTIGIDTIINQKTSDIFCVYVAIGQKSSSVRRAIDAIFGGGAPRALPRRRRRSREFAGAAMDRAVRGLHDGRIFSRSRPARARRHRRFDQTRRDPSRDRAADAAVARSRGLSRRRVLCARAAARARLETLEGERRRLADGIADRRNRRRKSERLYPDQPDLDHRWSDRSRRQAVPRRPEAGRRRRHERQPRRRQDPGARASRNGGDAAARLRAVPRTRSLHPLRRHVGCSGKAAIDARRAHSRDPRPAATCAFAPRGRSRAGAGGADGIDRRAALARRSGLPRRVCARRSIAARRRPCDRSRATARWTRRAKRSCGRSCKPMSKL